MRSDRRLEFTPEADDDLRALLTDTFESWGETQLSAYSNQLFAALRSLVTHPLLGRARNDLLPELRGLPAGHHVIYCVVDDETVTVIRLLHGKMDAARHIRPPQ